MYTDGATIQSGAAVPNRIAIPTTGHLEGQFSEIIKERSVQDGLKVIPGADMPNKPWSSNTNIVALFVTPGECINKSFFLAQILKVYTVVLLQFKLFFFSFADQFCVNNVNLILIGFLIKF